MYTTRKHSTYILSDTSAEVCRKGKEGSQTPRKQNHPPWQVNPPAHLHTRGLLSTSRPMKKEMGLILTRSNVSLKTGDHPFPREQGRTIARSKRKLADGWKESPPFAYIHLSPPFLAPGKEKGRPTAIAHNAPPGTLKRKDSLLGEIWQLFWDMAM